MHALTREKANSHSNTIRLRIAHHIPTLAPPITLRIRLPASNDIRLTILIAGVLEGRLGTALGERNVVLLKALWVVRIDWRLADQSVVVTFGEVVIRGKCGVDNGGDDGIVQNCGEIWCRGIKRWRYW